MPDFTWTWQCEQKKKDHRLIRQHPQFRCRESQRRQDTLQVKSRYVVSRYRILTHVRPTRSPDPGPGVPRPWVRTPGLCWLGPQGGNERAPLGMVERGRVGLLSPLLSQESPPFSPLVLCAINCFYSCHDKLLNTTLDLAGLILSCSTEVWRKHTRRRAERQGAGLCWVETVDWKEITAATSPAALWLFAWSMCPAISSPGEPASLPAMLILENGIITR